MTYETQELKDKIIKKGLFTSKDLYWIFGSTIKHADGTVTKNPGGWHAECKCGNPMRINIEMEVEK